VNLIFQKLCCNILSVGLSFMFKRNLRFVVDWLIKKVRDVQE